MDRQAIETLLKLREKATPGPVTIKYEDLGDEIVCWAPIEIIGANNFRIVAYDGGLAPDDEWQVETLEANAALIVFAFNQASDLARKLLAAMDETTEKDRKIERLERVAKQAEVVHSMCVNIGDFRNGITYQGIDEGEVMANRELESLKQALADLETPPEWCPAKENEWGPDHCVGKEPDCDKCKQALESGV